MYEWIADRLSRLGSFENVIPYITIIGRLSLAIMCYYKYHSAWSGNVNIYLLYTCTYHSRANYIFILSFNCSKFSVCLGILMIEFEVLFTVPFIAFLLTVFFIQQRSTYIWIYEYCTSKYSLWLCLYLPSWKEGKPSFHPSSSLSFFFYFPCHSPSSLLYHIYHALLLYFPFLRSPLTAVSICLSVWQYILSEWLQLYKSTYLFMMNLPNFYPFSELPWLLFLPLFSLCSSIRSLESSQVLLINLWIFCLSFFFIYRSGDHLHFYNVETFWAWIW